MVTKLGKGFGVKMDAAGRERVTDFRHKLGSVSDQIKKRKNRKPKAVGKMRAAMAAQRGMKR